MTKLHKLIELNELEKPKIRKNRLEDKLKQQKHYCE